MCLSYRIQLSENKVYIDVDCKLDVKGKYDLAGRLLILPIEGHGNFSILISMFIL